LIDCIGGFPMGDSMLSGVSALTETRGDSI
jgi:hypothetical protein